MKYLGIDYGTKRIGVAVSDDGGKLAFPLTTLEAGRGALSQVHALIQEKGIDKVVIGESRNFEGVANPVQEDIAQFKKDLEELAGVVVAYEPEFLTSAQALRQAQDKPAQSLDAAAAALILQGFLDKMNQ